MTAKEIIRRLKTEGWYEADTRGSHIQFKHPEKPGKITIAFHSGDIKPGTLNSIKKQAGWK